MFDARAYHRERIANVEATVGPDAEPWATDRRLREYAHQRARLDAAESFDLIRAEKMRIHIDFGCATFLEYLERRLGYSVHTARERIRVARELATLPVITSELAKGNLSFSVARELSRVATPETEEAFVERAKFKTCREVEELVAGRVRGDGPEDPPKPELRLKDLRLRLPTEHHALWREARKKLADERGAENVSDADLFEALCRNFLQPGTGAEGPPHQIAYKQCNDCGRATQNGAGREIPVAPSVFERAACDARVIGSLDASMPERATSTVTPRVREQVFARDDHRCQVPGCRSSRNLEIHHIRPQAQGGSNDLWNMTLICGGHHAAHHDGFIRISGRAPGIKVAWIAPPQPSIDPEDTPMREALLEREIERILQRTVYAGRTRAAGHDSHDGRVDAPLANVPRGTSTSAAGPSTVTREVIAEVPRGSSTSAAGPSTVARDVIAEVPRGSSTSAVAPSSVARDVIANVPRGTS